MSNIYGKKPSIKSNLLKTGTRSTKKNTLRSTLKMSKKTKSNPCLEQKDLEKIVSILQNNYDKNKNRKVDLTGEQKKLLDQLSNQAVTLISGRASGKSVDKDKCKRAFEDIVIRMCHTAETKSPTKKGGQLTRSTRRNSGWQRKGIITNDLYVMSGFVIAIILIYLSYDDFCSMTSLVTGLRPSEIGEAAMTNIQNELKKNENNKLTFFQYIYRIIGSLSTSLIENQRNFIVLILEKVILETTPSMTQNMASCVTHNRDGVLGKLHSIAALALNSQSARACATTITMSEIKFAQAAQRRKIENLLGLLSHQQESSIKYMTTGVSLGGACITYTAFRFGIGHWVPSIMLPNQRATEPIQEENEDYEEES